MILAYSIRADALAHELSRALGEHADVAEVRARRRDLDAAATAMEQVGWVSPKAPTVRIAADRTLLEAAFRSILTDAVEDLSATAESGDSSAAALQRMRDAVERTRTALDRLAEVVAPEAGPPDAQP